MWHGAKNSSKRKDSVKKVQKHLRRTKKGGPKGQGYATNKGYAGILRDKVLHAKKKNDDSPCRTSRAGWEKTGNLKKRSRRLHEQKGQDQGNSQKKERTED